MLFCSWLLGTRLAFPFFDLSPRQFSTHYFNLGPSGESVLLAADGAGNFFMVSKLDRGLSSVMRVSKLDDSGNVLATFDFRDTGSDLPYAAAVDPGGNLVIGGASFSPDFPLVSPLQTSGAGFLTKLDSQLNGIVFSTRVGSPTTASGGGPAVNAIAFDSAGNVYLTGNTGPGMPVSEGAVQPRPPALGPYALESHGFVAEISAAGDKLLFSTYFTGGAAQCAIFCGGPPPNRQVVITTTPIAIAVDAPGDVIISGSTNVTDLPVTPGAYAAQCGCDERHRAGFVAKIGNAGTKLIWGTYLPLTGGSTNGGIHIASMALDAGGDILLAGDTPGGLPVTPDALQASFPPVSDAALNPSKAGFLAKLAGTGSKLLYGSYFGGNTEGSMALPAPVSGVRAIAVDRQGAIWLTGGSAPEALPPNAAPVLGQSYVAALSPDGGSIAALYMAPEGVGGNALAVSSRGVVAALGFPDSLLIAKSAAGPSVMGVAGSARFRASQTVAPRELISVYGLGIGPASPQPAVVTDGVIGDSLGGVQVLFDGKPAALLYAGPTQINAIVPNAVAGQASTAIQIVTPSGTVEGPGLQVTAVQPEVFTDIGGHAAALNEDGTLNSASSPAPLGSVVAIWMTGGGAGNGLPDNRINTSLNPNPQSIAAVAYFNTLRGGFQGLEVLYDGDAPLLPSGVTQVNFRLSASLPPAWIVNGQLRCYVAVNSVGSDFFTIYVK